MKDHKSETALIYLKDETDKLMSYAGRAGVTRHIYIVFVGKHETNNHFSDPDS
jgi:hypothetical protein